MDRPVGHEVRRARQRGSICGAASAGSLGGEGPAPAGACSKDCRSAADHGGLTTDTSQHFATDSQSISSRVHGRRRRTSDAKNQGARPTNETCIVDSRGDRRVGSAPGARHPHRPVGSPGPAGDRDRGLVNTDGMDSSRFSGIIGPRTLTHVSGINRRELSRMRRS